MAYQIIYKQDTALQPILVSYKTPSYRISKYIAPRLQKHTSNGYHNSFELQKSIFTMNLRNTPYLASFDVQSLITSIALGETTDLICNIIVENQTTVHNMPAAELKLIFISRMK